MNQYLNLWLAGPSDDQQYQAQQIFDADDIFIQDVPPFEKRASTARPSPSPTAPSSSG